VCNRCRCNKCLSRGAKGRGGEHAFPKGFREVTDVSPIQESLGSTVEPCNTRCQRQARALHKDRRSNPACDWRSESALPCPALFRTEPVQSLVVQILWVILPGGIVLPVPKRIRAAKEARHGVGGVVQAEGVRVCVVVGSVCRVKVADQRHSTADICLKTKSERQRRRPTHTHTLSLSLSHTHSHTHTHTRTHARARACESKKRVAGGRAGGVIGVLEHARGEPGRAASAALPWVGCPEPVGSRAR
jgi:hypothetical protein